jgi:NAD-dependent dihydropyrimidine dehydrogenase PreA subunit
MTYVITEGCVDLLDKTCISVCPVDCIYEGDRKLYIQSDECIDCGACEPVCPVEAIYYERDVPDDKSAFIRIDKEVFELEPAVGSPGGAERHGKIPDHPDVAAIPHGE